MSFFSKKNILITGANGYIGSSVAKKLSQYDCKLSLISRNNNPKHDVTNKDFWSSVLKDIDIVFHFAGQTSSQVANQQPLLDLQTNVLPIINLIDTCIKYKYSPNIIFAGTVTETGMTDKGKINEDHIDIPITIYDINKLAAEKYLQYYSNQLGNRAVTLRLCNIYGPGPTSRRPDRGIVNLMIKNALKNEPIMIFGDGNYMRDYLYIDDVVSAFISSAEHIEKTKGNYYVLGTGIGHTIFEMAKTITHEVQRIAKKKIELNFAPFPHGTSQIEYRNFVADCSRFKKDTGWSAKISLEEGIRRTIEHFI